MPKNTIKLSVFFALLRSAHVKAALKHFDEIDPSWWTAISTSMDFLTPHIQPSLVSTHSLKQLPDAISRWNKTRFLSLFLFLFLSFHLPLSLHIFRFLHLYLPPSLSLLPLSLSPPFLSLFLFLFFKSSLFYLSFILSLSLSPYLSYISNFFLEREK